MTATNGLAIVGHQSVAILNYNHNVDDFELLLCLLVRGFGSVLVSEVNICEVPVLIADETNAAQVDAIFLELDA